MARKALSFNAATQDSRGNWWAQETDEDGNFTDQVLVDPVSGEDSDGNTTPSYRAVVSGGRGDESQAIDSRIREREMLGYSPDIAERFAINLPAALPTEGKNWAVGQEVSPADFQAMIQRLNQKGAYEGVDGMTPAQYLSDPRAAVRSEGGRLVYRPDLMQGDFMSIDQESLMESLGAFPYVLGAFAAPFAASLGAAGAASGLNAVNSFDTGAMGSILGTGAEAGVGGFTGLLGEAGSLSGVSDLGWNVAELIGTELGTAAAEATGIQAGAEGFADGINWGSDIFNPDAVSTFTGDPTAGWNVADYATSSFPSLTPPGSPPGVNSGTQAPAPVVNKDPGIIERMGLGKYLDQSTLDKLLKYGPLALGPLQTLQQRNATKDAAGRIGALGSGARDVGQSIVDGFKNGTLNPADLAGIDRWERQSVAQMRQFFARTGRSNSTSAVQSEADIRARAEEMRAQSRQNLLTTGLNALGISDKYELASIQAELQGDQTMAESASRFLNSYGAWLRALPTLTGQQPAAKA